jgi:hypothetical protein
MASSVLSLIAGGIAIGGRWCGPSGVTEFPNAPQQGSIFKQA